VTPAIGRFSIFFRFEQGFVHVSYFNELTQKYPFAWIKFQTPQEAQACTAKFHGIKLDVDLDMPLALTMAKKNSMKKQVKSDIDFLFEEFLYKSGHRSGMGRGASSLTATQRREGISGVGEGVGVPARSSTPGKSVVYLGNLGENFSEDEVRLLVSSLKGVTAIRFNVSPSGQGFGFVEFEKGSEAISAIASLNGQVISTSTGLKVELARSSSGILGGPGRPRRAPPGIPPEEGSRD